MSPGYSINVASLYLFIGAVLAFIFFLIYRKKLIGGFWGALIAGVVGSFLGAVVATFFQGKMALRVPKVYGTVNVIPSVVFALIFLVVFTNISKGRGSGK